MKKQGGEGGDDFWTVDEVGARSRSVESTRTSKDCRQTEQEIG